MAIAEVLIPVLLLGLLEPVSASVGQTKQIAWICFAVFIVFFILGSLYVRQRRTWRSQRGPANRNGEAPAPVSAWGKAAPPKDNGKAGFGQSVAHGAWERDA
eukprot:g8076.t1